MDSESGIINIGSLIIRRYIWDAQLSWCVCLAVNCLQASTLDTENLSLKIVETARSGVVSISSQGVWLVFVLTV